MYSESTSLSAQGRLAAVKAESHAAVVALSDDIGNLAEDLQGVQRDSKATYEVSTPMNKAQKHTITRFCDVNCDN